VLAASERELGGESGAPINLKSAHLQEAVFRFATLSAANLQAADLAHADLVHARLTRANLLQTLVSFDGALDARLEFHFGLFADNTCRLRDGLDNKALGL